MRLPAHTRPTPSIKWLQWELCADHHEEWEESTNYCSGIRATNPLKRTRAAFRLQWVSQATCSQNFTSTVSSTNIKSTNKYLLDKQTSAPQTKFANLKRREIVRNNWKSQTIIICYVALKRHESVKNNRKSQTNLATLHWSVVKVWEATENLLEINSFQTDWDWAIWTSSFPRDEQTAPP